jgi:hypothetical protein
VQNKSSRLRPRALTRVGVAASIIERGELRNVAVKVLHKRDVVRGRIHSTEWPFGEEPLALGASNVVAERLSNSFVPVRGCQCKAAACE